MISIRHDRLDLIQNYSIASELLLAAGIPDLEKKKWARKYRLFFHPKEFVGEHPILTLENYRLS